MRRASRSATTSMLSLRWCATWKSSTRVNRCTRVRQSNAKRRASAEPRSNIPRSRLTHLHPLRTNGHSLDACSDRGCATMPYPAHFGPLPEVHCFAKHKSPNSRRTGVSGDRLTCCAAEIAINRKPAPAHPRVEHGMSDFGATL
jgi:hypothetical protein